MEGSTFLFISLIAIVIIAWKRKSKGRKRTSVNRARSAKIMESRQVIIDSAQRLAEIINESLTIANESKNAATKISRLDVAKQKLVDLKKLAKEYPFIKLDQLSDVEESISNLELEFLQKSYREAANGNVRGQELEKEGNIKEAILEYERLLREEVDTPFTYRRLAIIYSKRKEREEELRVLRAAIKNVPIENSKHYQWFSERLAKKA